MSIKKDNVSVTAVKYNSQDVNKVILDNKCVWCKPFTYTQGTLPTGVASLTCTRSSTDEPTASTGTIANGGTIYYDDKLYWEATASTGYRITAVKGSGSPVTVSGAITGTTASGLTSARISGTISQGTLPPEVASITCYRKAYNENSFSKYTGSTIYYGDQFYWTATAATEYNNPSLTYNSSSKVYTWNGKQGGSIDSVSASGLSAGTRRSFTISFGTTANKTLYGSWSSSSQTAYYGDKITVSGTTVTCYKWEATSTARWTVTVSASSNTAEYTYSAVTIAESNIASVTAEAAFTAYNTRTLNSYTVTWKYLSAYPDTWATATQSYNYGATPSRTNSSTVTNTSNTLRKVFTSWDSLATVTGNRTITANYKTQVNATFQGTRCSAKIDNVAVSNNWYDINKTVTWTADPNCAFSSDGSTTTTTDTISTQKTNYTASANYVNVTKLIGTHCSTTAKTGWKSITDKITWTADTAYAFDTSNTTTSQPIAVVPGENKYTASYVKQYKLTISVTNGSYGTYSVTRDSSKYQGAGTGVLSNGATIYYGDVLKGTSSAKAASYDDWSVTSVTAPTFTTTGDATSGNLTITNKSSYQAILYYNTSNDTGGTLVGEVAANGSKTVSGLSFNTQYYISARVDRTRTKHIYATDGDQYSGTNGVTGNVTATFKFKDTTETWMGMVYSSVVAAKTAAQNKYTVTFSTTSGQYGSWGTASISNVPYGTTITRNDNTVTVGNAGSSTFAPALTTVQYNYASPTFSVPGSVTGATTITGGCERSDRLYTIQWIGENGSTVLETDSNVKYGAVLTYNGSTPSKASTDQYSYAFSAWKLGSTSGSTVTSGSTTNAGSTSSTTIKIYSTFTSTVRSYTVTWKYLSAYPDTWTTATESYNYGATPSRANPSTVTSGNARKIVIGWDNLNTVTGNRTITATYITQFAPTISSNYCTATVQPLQSGPWYDSGTEIIWTADDNYSFNGTAVKDTTKASITSGDTYSATPGYIKCTISGTNCWADRTTGNIFPVGETITWTGDTGTNCKYSFSNTNPDSTTDTAKVELGLTSYKKEAPYLWCNVTSVTGTNCTAYADSNCTTPFTTGWHLTSDNIYWKASPAYAFDKNNSDISIMSVSPGENTLKAIYVKRYTLSLSKYANVSSIKAWRTASPYQGATIGSESSPLLNGSGFETIYYGDSLAMEANADRYYYFSGNKSTLSQTVPTVTNDVSWDPKIAGVTTFDVTITAGTGVSSVYLSTDQNATSGSPSGTAFAAGTTVYAFAVINTESYTAPSGWEHVRGNIYRVGSAVMGYTGSPNFGTINATPKQLYTVTVSCDRTGGLSKAYLSDSSTATSGSTSLKVASGTTVYGFAVLNSYKSADQFTGWALISGTSNTPGAIYRVGSKKITANTTYYINLFEESDDSAVIFKRSGASAGSWTVKNHEIQSASGSSKIYQSGNSIYARYDDYNGSEHDILLGTFNCPAGYAVTFTLSDYAGNRISLGSSVNLEGPGPYTVMAWVEEDTTTT